MAVLSSSAASSRPARLPGRHPDRVSGEPSAAPVTGRRGAAAHRHGSPARDDVAPRRSHRRCGRGSLAHLGLRRALLGEVTHDRRHLVRSAPRDPDLEVAPTGRGTPWRRQGSGAHPYRSRRRPRDTSRFSCRRGQDVARSARRHGLDGSASGDRGARSGCRDTGRLASKPDHQVRHRVDERPLPSLALAIEAHEQSQGDRGRGQDPRRLEKRQRAPRELPLPARRAPSPGHASRIDPAMRTGSSSGRRRGGATNHRRMTTIPAKIDSAIRPYCARSRPCLAAGAGIGPH